MNQPSRASTWSPIVASKYFEIVPITPRSTSLSALTSVFSGVGPGWIASQDWHRDGARDGARRVWRGCGIYCEGRGRVFSGVSPG